MSSPQALGYTWTLATPIRHRAETTDSILLRATSGNRSARYGGQRIQCPEAMDESPKVPLDSDSPDAPRISKEVWKIRSRYTARYGATAISVLGAPGSVRFDDWTSPAWRRPQSTGAQSTALLAAVPALAVLERR
jgi:hypothetical protein